MALPNKTNLDVNRTKERMTGNDDLTSWIAMVLLVDVVSRRVNELTLLLVAGFAYGISLFNIREPKRNLKQQFVLHFLCVFDPNPFTCSELQILGSNGASKIAERMVISLLLSRS